MSMKKLPIEKLIENLGFSGSKNLVNIDMLTKLDISKHDVKTLKVINPYAIYLVNSKPFILFIESSFEEKKLQQISSLYGMLKYQLLLYAILILLKYLMEKLWI